MNNLPDEYFVKEDGTVISHKYKNPRALTQWINKNTGYLSVTISINGKKYNKDIHRLVAQKFIENPDNKKYVNHKDGNKSNNDISNLEWVTFSENMQHAYDNDLISKKSKVKHIESGNTFSSLSECARSFNISRQVICDHCKGRVKNVKFEYVN